MKKIAAAIGILLIPVLVVLLGNWRMEAYYNEGNEHYNVEEFSEAIASYEEALKWYPTEKQECKIRINMALSIIHTIDFEQLETYEDIEEAIGTLEEAKEVLLVDDCASDQEGKTGHNEDAQQLKEDIDKMIEELQKQTEETKESNESNESDESEDESKEESGETEESGGDSDEIQIEQIESQLESIEQDSLNERESEMEEVQELYDYSWLDNDGLSW